MSSGLRKQKKYDWKDSNLALFGSDTEKEVKKESAMTEPAWEGAGQEVGLQIWRIEQFEVKHWPKEEYGEFYSGDSYIILNTYKKDPDSEVLDYDVHFWIGKYSSQDEYGTAAYKTVELDTFLDDKAVQHREVQNHESNKFKSYFSALVIREGGCATGFRHVEPTEYIPRLLRFNGKRSNITVTEVPCNRARLNTDDVFIYDGGEVIYQWNGSGANKDEQFKAAQFVSHLKSDRAAESEVYDEESISESHQFYDLLNDEDDEDDDEVDTSGVRELYKVSDADGSIGMELVKEGEFGPDDLTSDDVFLVDVGYHCFVYVGAAASNSEKRNAMSYAHNHLQKSSHPCTPVSILHEGADIAEFNNALSA